MAIAVPKSLRQFATNIPLRWVLVVPFVLQTVGAVALVGYLSYRSGQQATENLANQLLEQTSDRVSDRLSSYLQASQRIVAANRLAVEQGTLNLNDQEQLRRHLWQQIVLDSSLPANGYWSEDGTALSYVRIASEAPRKLAEKISGQSIPLGTVFLNEIKPNQRRYFWTDAQGKPGKLAYQLNDDFRTVAWYHDAKRLGKQGWTPVSVARVLPVLQIFAVTPVLDTAGKLQGLFTASYLLAEISLFLNQLQFSPTGQSFIVERSGDLIATSIASEAAGLRMVNGKPKRLHAVDSQDERTREVTKQLLQRFGSFRNLNGTQQLSFGINNQQQFVQVSPYKDNYGLDWLVITVIPASDFMAGIQANNARTTLLCWFTLFAATAIGAITSRWISKPILKLSRASEELAQGTWTQSLSEKTPIAEIKTLTHSFNRTAEQLQHSFDLIKIALQESEEKFTKVFQTSPDPIMISTAQEGRYLEVNESFTTLTGYSREEAIGHTAAELSLLVNPDQRLALLQQLQAQGKAKRLELDVCKRSGEIGTVLISSELIELEGQTCILSVCKDITDRKRAETAWQEAEEQLALVLRGSNDGWWDWDLVQNTIYYSPRWWEMLGYRNSELNATPDLWQQLMHPEDRDRVNTFLQEQLESHVKSYEMECRLQHKQGHFIPIIARAFISRDSNGKPIRMSGTNTDLTSLKQTEASLRKALQYVGTHFEHSPLAIMEWMQDGTILRWSAQAAKLFGWTAEEVLKKSWDELALIHEADRDRVFEELTPLLNGSATNLMVQNRNYTKDGRVIICQWYSSAVFDETGALASVLSFAEDITDRFNLERMKDEFISIVSHELRTPLTSIRGSIGMLDSGVLDDEPETAKHMLKVAVNNSDRLIRLVNDILDLERLESGKTQMVMEPCNVNDLMQQAVDSVQAIADEARVTISVSSLSTIVHADPDAIVQVLTNLLGNAIKFSSGGSQVWLKAELQGVEEWKNEILFSITDQGRGIPLEKLESIFGRFQQVDVSDSRQKGGTGLGLAICRNIVQQHRGQIWVESAVGKGSTFYFTVSLDLNSGNGLRF